MERRAFLQFLAVGLGVASGATVAEAVTLVHPLDSRPSGRATIKPQPSVATPDDIDNAKVEDVYYGHYRRVNRRVSRRVYRRHYY